MDARTMKEVCLGVLPALDTLEQLELIRVAFWEDKESEQALKKVECGHEGCSEGRSWQGTLAEGTVGAKAKRQDKLPKKIYMACQGHLARSVCLETGAASDSHCEDSMSSGDKGPEDCGTLYGPLLYALITPVLCGLGQILDSQSPALTRQFG
ncbi:hypothetical protein STEG23_038061 [Scotinomys teguina]